MSEARLFQEPEGSDPIALLKQLMQTHDLNANQLAHRLGVSQATLSRWMSGTAFPRPSAEVKIRKLDSVLKAAEMSRQIGIQSIREGTNYDKLLSSLRESFHKLGRFSNRNELIDELSKLLFAHIANVTRGMKGINAELCGDGSCAVNLIQFVRNSFRSFLPTSISSHFSLEDFELKIKPSEDTLAYEIISSFDKLAPTDIDADNFYELDVLNESFGRFLSDSFADEKQLGQYLTPSEVIDFCIDLLEPEFLDFMHRSSAAPVVLDPSCGAGSFLTAYLHRFLRLLPSVYSEKKWSPIASQAAERLFGIDKSDRMLKLSITSFATFGINIANLHLGNSLSDWQDSWSPNNLDDKVDFILTNPPFGAEFPSREMSTYTIAQGQRQEVSINSEILFLERYLRWLKDGGILLAIVPDSILSNKGIYKNLRDLLSSRAELMAVISLPAVTFASAGTTTKTSILVLRACDSPKVDGKTFMAVASAIGYDVTTQGNIKKKKKVEKNDLPGIADLYRKREDGALGRWVEGVAHADRWDANFHVGAPAHIDALLADGSQGILLTDIAEIVNERLNPMRSLSDQFPYVEISDVDALRVLVTPKLVATQDAPSRARKVARLGDVLLSTVRPERKTIGILNYQGDYAICSTGLAVLRPKGISPFLLVRILQSEVVTHQLLKHNIGIAYPAIDESCLKDIRIPLSLKDIQGLETIAHSAYELLITAEQTASKFKDEVVKLLP